MIGGTHKNLKEEILEILLQKPASSKSIHSRLKEKNISITIQSIYTQLKTLLKSKVILKNKQIYSVSNEWIKKVSQIIDVQEIELPEEGEKFTYKFNSLQNLDEHWKHTTTAFNNTLKNEAMFLYSHHQFWIYTPTREKSEEDFVYESVDKKQYTFYVIGGVTDLDKKYRNEFKGEYFKIENFSIKPLKEKEHIFVIDNFIINVRTSEDVAKKIDEIYKLDESIPVKENLLKKFLEQKHKVMFTIENNTKKATKIKKKIIRPFYVPNSIREKIK